MIREYFFNYLMQHDQEFHDAVVGRAAVFATELMGAANTFGEDPDVKVKPIRISKDAAQAFGSKRSKPKKYKNAQEQVLVYLKSRGKAGATGADVIEFSGVERKNVYPALNKLKTIDKTIRAIKKKGYSLYVIK